MEAECGGGALAQIKTYFDTVTWHLILSFLFVFLGGFGLSVYQLHQLATPLTKVVASKNLGVHLNEVFGGSTRLVEVGWYKVLQVIQHWFPETPEAMDRLLVGPPTTCPKPMATMIPTDSLDDFYLPLSAFDLTAGAKNGCAGFSQKSKLFLTMFNGYWFWCYC